MTKTAAWTTLANTLEQYDNTYIHIVPDGHNNLTLYKKLLET